MCFPFAVCYSQALLEKIMFVLFFALFCKNFFCTKETSVLDLRPDLRTLFFCHGHLVTLEDVQ